MTTGVGSEALGNEALQACAPVICISGMPGSGKTTVAKHLAIALGIECIVQTDVLKGVFAALHIHEDLIIPTHQAWRRSGDINRLIPDFVSIVDAYTPILQNMARYFQERSIPVIFEGVHVTLAFAQSIGASFFFLDVDDLVRKQRLQTKGAANRVALWMQGYDSITAVNEYLRKEWSPYVYINDSLQKTVQYICAACSNRGSIGGQLT